MDSLLSPRLIEKLSFLGATSQALVIGYLNLLQARNYARSTLDAVAITIKRFVLHISKQRRTAIINDLAQATVSDVDCFVDTARSKGLSVGTINVTLSVLKEFFDFLRENGQVQVQPVIRRRHRLCAPTSLPKPMAESDLTRFFKVIDSLTDRLIFLLMLRCGLRVSEAISLRWEEIDLEGGTIRLNNSKGQVDRICYIAPDVERSLRLWQERSSSSAYLFPSRKRRSSRLGRGNINWLMNKYLRLALIQTHYSPHCLRHSFATQLLNAGVSLEVLKELMGHQSIQITLRYTLLYESTKRHQYDQAMEKITKRQANLGR
jgi:site-specific recombinase XerD